MVLPNVDDELKRVKPHTIAVAMGLYLSLLHNMVAYSIKILLPSVSVHFIICVSFYPVLKLPQFKISNEF